MWDAHALYELPEGAAELQVTSDGAHTISVLDHGDGTISLVWDGVATEPYSMTEGGPDNGFMWSDDRKHMAFWAVRGEDSFIVADGRELGPFDAYTRNVPPVFAPDGRVTFGASPRGMLASTGTLVPTLFVNGRLQAEPALAPVPAVFSPDGSRLAYAAQAAPQVRPRWVLVDDRAGPEFEDIAMLGFSADGARFFYKAQQDGRWHFVIDGEVGPPVEDVVLAAVSPDSRRFLYIAVERGKGRLFLDGRPASDDDVRFAMFSPDSGRVAYLTVGAGDRAGYVVEGHPEPLHKAVRHSATGFFSPDSRHHAYLAADEEGGFLSKKARWYLVRDGERVGEVFDDVGTDPEFSPESARVAFAGQRDRRWSIAVDGRPEGDWDAVSRPQWASNGRLGYLATATNARRIVVDGASGPLFDQIKAWDPGFARGLVPFSFTADGRHLVAAVVVGGQSRPLVDHHLGPEFDSVQTPHFQDGRAAFIAVRNRSVIRVSRDLD